MAIIMCCLIRLVRLSNAEGNIFGVTLNPIEFELVLFLVVLGMLLLIIPPDFEYSIRVLDDSIVIENSEEDYRRIDKTFNIISKKRHYLVLDDGFSRIRIAYNKEVLQFLNEIKN